MMPFNIANPVILLGLFALAVPIVLHFLQRRRFEVVDWAAMQFLPDSNVAQRRRWLDEVLLLLLRLSMIALIVLALATPFSTSGWLTSLGERPTRDIVLVLDGSYSMDVRVPGQASPWLEAIAGARKRIDDAGLGERFAILIARKSPHWVLDEFSANASELCERLRNMPEPRGNPDLPAGLGEAWQRLMTRSDAPIKQIIVLTDGQRFGWADRASLSALENLGGQWRQEMLRARGEGLATPSLHILRVGAERDKGVPGRSLAAITASRLVVRLGQTLTLRSALQLNNASATPVRFRSDDKLIQTINLAHQDRLTNGQLPFHIEHRFEKEGRHRVSFAVDADHAGDALAADNEQHAVIDVVKEVPTLIVDGGGLPALESSSYFLHRALAPDAKSGVRALGYQALNADTLSLDQTTESRPPVVILADVPRLDAKQIDALERFVAKGGGLLVVVAERAARDRAFYNEQAWLPAKLSGLGALAEGVQPDPRSFQHPALEVFRSSPEGSMSQVRVTKWHTVRLAAEDRAAAVALFSNGDPFLLEKAYKKGRALLITTPMDRTWNSTLPSAWEFPILVHELTAHLAGGLLGASKLEPGEPIRLPLEPDAIVKLSTPEVKDRSQTVNSSLWSYPDTGAIGVYSVWAEPNRSWTFVVPPDLRESELERCSEDDWQLVHDRLPVKPRPSDGPAGAHEDSAASRDELWWIFLLGVLALLCVEVWMTRRMALLRGR